MRSASGGVCVRQPIIGKKQLKKEGSCADREELSYETNAPITGIRFDVAEGFQSCFFYEETIFSS